MIMQYLSAINIPAIKKCYEDGLAMNYTDFDLVS